MNTVAIFIKLVWITNIILLFIVIMHLTAMLPVLQKEFIRFGVNLKKLIEFWRVDL